MAFTFVVVVYENLSCFNDLFGAGFPVTQMMASGFNSVSIERMAPLLDKEMGVSCGLCCMERLGIFHGIFLPHPYS